MSVSQWITSFFQPQRPTSCNQHLLNKVQPLHTLQPLDPVELMEAQPVVDPALELSFQKNISNLGGKENILLVGEAGCNADDWNRGLLEDLSFALFGMPQKLPSWKKGMKASKGHQRSLSYVTSDSPSKARMLDFPIILAIFRDTLITDTSNSTLLREMLSDVQLRTRKSGSAVVGIVYVHQPCTEERAMELRDLLSKLMSRIFRRQPWGVCCYFTFQSKSIEEVKWTIVKTLSGVTGVDLYSEYQSFDVNRSFRDLIVQLGGKERFLLVGNICPSTSPSEKAGAFKELTKALFDDAEESCTMGAQQAEEESLTTEQKMTSSKECLQLPKPRPFPYPLILVAFRSAFIKEESNRAQIKEILADIKTRVKMSSTRVIGVVCSQEQLEEAERLELQLLLQKFLCQIFDCSIAVCSFVRTKPETVDHVKRCVCGILCNCKHK
ncbi:uncharacterized protein PAF06_010101 [Gastrophryne carolinensis]